MQRTVWAMIAATLAGAPLGAQVRTVDPNQAGSLAAPSASSRYTPPTGVAPARDDAPPAEAAPSPAVPADDGIPPDATAPPPSSPPDARRQARDAAANTYRKQDVLTAAEGVFGKGAAGLAGLIEKIFRDQGQPTAYIAGREAGGAVVVGVRYGSGMLFDKVEGQRPVHWTGPSVGFDLGANGAKTFVLIYNMYDTQELYRRFPAAEGNVYVVGGFTASYLRYKSIVVIPIRLGVGARLGANVGYMHFTEQAHWAPF